MKFPGFWVVAADGRVKLAQVEFDDTDLDPQTDWQEAWQNQDISGAAKGFVRLSEAITFAAGYFVGSQGAIPESVRQELSTFRPQWKSGIVWFESLDDILSSCKNAESDDVKNVF